MKLYNHIDGYTEAVVDGNRTLLHRVIYEKYHKVKLTTKDVIHHIDGDKENNSISNLKLMTLAEHSKLHASERSQKIKELECAQCGQDYLIALSLYNYKIKKGQKIFVCSKRCAGLLNSKYLPKKKQSVEYLENVIEGLNDGLTGYAIAKKYDMNRKTVYNIINSLK
jgi:hypothetical protein